MALMHLLYFAEIQAFKTHALIVAIIIITMKNCNDFQVHRCIECIRELEAAKDQGSSRLQCRPKDDAAYSVMEQCITVSRSLLLWVQNVICAKRLYGKLK